MMNTVDWLTRLIAFDTTSRHSNLALIHHVADYLQSLGLEPWLTHNAAQTKANLFVTLPDAMGGVSGGMVLSGHTDVVPVDGQDWQSDPFCAEIRQERVYGRGSCDMKGFIASALALLPQALATPKRMPLHLALSYDEEVGCLGAPVMLEAMLERGLNPEYCIVGEPTSMALVVAHKGINVFRCRVHGHSVHSSLTPKGVNAIEYAARLIVFIQELAQSLARRADLDPAFDVPFSTLSAGLISGGSATNIVPELCEFYFDYRNLPAMRIDEILEPIQQYIDECLQPAMQRIAPEAHIELVQTERVPAMTEHDCAPLRTLMQALVQDGPKQKVAYATEGGQFQMAGIPTVICGPGDIRQAHRPDEYVSLEQLQKCDDFLSKMLSRMAVGA